jgi:serine/tyrosine/threonine adenylyltransferase
MEINSLKLAELKFDNSFVKQLPGDPIKENYCRQVSSACYSLTNPTPCSKPTLLAHSNEVGHLLELSPAVFETEEFAQVFSGNKVLPGMQPHATCYGGHQFGNWAGQLGDGRAITLGEAVTSQGLRYALQLKGSGMTPYSRTADGRAVLRSSAREFLCSEAMHHLGVPTTRALSLVLTGDEVMRDMFYDGNAMLEPTATVCRVAPSFTRFGHFQLLAAQGENTLLKNLVDYTINTDFPELGLGRQANASLTAQDYGFWFKEVCDRTAKMVSEWMRVGFVHGVMNTDNMSILGLTIDYGPYGWLEDYDPNWTPNTTDAGGKRYRYGQQSQVALWNLAQLANALHPLINDLKPLEDGLASFQSIYETHWHSALAAKLGLERFVPSTDISLSNDLFQLLREVETDMTIFFRKLGVLHTTSDWHQTTALQSALAPAYYMESQVDENYDQNLSSWLTRYKARVESDGLAPKEKKEMMDRANPKYVIRNYLAQISIDDAAGGDFSTIRNLLNVLKSPYDEQPEHEEYANRRPEWARHRAGCSMLSCSS